MWEETLKSISVQIIISIPKEPVSRTFEAVYTDAVKTKEDRQVTNNFSYSRPIYTHFFVK